MDRIKRPVRNFFVFSLVWTVLVLVNVPAGVSAQTTTTYPLTIQGLHLFAGSSGDPTGVVGRYPRGSLLASSPYSDEITCYNNLSSLTNVTVSGVKFRFNITTNISPYPPCTLWLAEQDHQTYKADADYDYYKRTSAWDKRVCTKIYPTAPGAGTWDTLTSSGLITLVQSWVDTSSNNKGLVLFGNFRDWNPYWTIGTAELIITYTSKAPAITSQPRDTIARLGSPVSFKATATSGITPVTFLWRHRESGSWIEKSSQNVTSSPATSIYSITTTAVTDSGACQVIVSNSSGSVTSNTVNLTLCPSPPSQTIVKGGSATFNAQVYGPNPNTYQWQKYTGSWVPVSGATGASYSLTNVPFGDTVFRCSFTKGITLYSDPCTLFVQAPVKILSFKPATTPQFIKVGGALLCTVTVEANPAATYSWEKQAGLVWQPAPGAANQNTYTIAAVAGGDTGFYRVKVTNTVLSIPASDSSFPLELKVYENPVISAHPRDTIIGVGGLATFTIATSAGFPLTYYWQQRLKGSGTWTSIPGATGISYTTLSVVTSDDSTSFRCIVRSPGDSAISNPGSILLVNTPSASIKPLSLAVNRGTTAIFTATVGGVPIPSVTWERNTGGGWSTIAGKTELLCTLSTVAYTDSGYYRVKATNASGSAVSDSAKLIVCRAPIIIDASKDILALVGATAKFWVRADGYPLTYQWQKKAPSQVFSDITGAIKDTMVFTVSTTDNGAYYRCAVKTPLSTVYSDSARLSTSAIPTTQSYFNKNNPLAVGGNIVLAGSSAGIPAPSVTWYFVRPPGQIPVEKGTEDTLKLNNAAKTDSGFYYFVASNTFGKAGSDTAYVHVLKPAAITRDLPVTYTAVQGGTMKLRLEAEGEGVLNYQWYCKDTLQTGKTNPLFDFGPVDSLKHKLNTYYCKVWNTFLGKEIAGKTSVVCTLLIGIYFNPFIVNVNKKDNRTLELEISADSTIMLMATEGNPLIPPPWCDSLWIMYKTKGYAKTATEATVVRYPTKAIKNQWPQVTKYTLPVPPLTSSMPHDSCYYVNHTVKWHALLKDTLLASFLQAGKVFMIDTDGVQNPLVVSGIYIPSSDSALLVVSAIDELVDSLHDSLTVECSRDSLFTLPLLFREGKLVGPLLAQGKNSDTLILDNLGTVPLPASTIYCRWYVTGKNGAKSAYRKSFFYIGLERPVFTGTFRADSTTSSTEIAFTWTMPDTGIDSMRIWYDTKKTLTIGDLPVNLVLKNFYAAPYGITDTLDNLADNTQYYLWLQILRNNLWSRITPACTASVITAHGDTVVIANTIKVETSWFDTLTNEIKVQWNIDTTGLPLGKTYYAGHTYSLDTVTFMTNTPDWKPLHQGVDTTAILLGNTIRFDTSYSAGIWIRGRDIVTGKTTRPAGPTDTSRCITTVPGFTWQYISFTSNKIPDTQYIANKKIAFRTFGTVGFDFSEKVTGYKRITPLPTGFVKIGGVSFKFTSINPQIYPIIAEMRYNPLSPQIPQNKIRIFRDIRGYLCTRYSSCEAGGKVQDTITKNDFDYPFLALADTMTPDIIPRTYDTVVDAGIASLTTRFTIKENSGNAWYELLHGAGNTGFPKKVKDTLKSGSDSLSWTIPNTDNVVNGSFGLRARVIVHDGVSADTVDVSRMVRNTQGEGYSVNSAQWSPLRTSLTLQNNGSLDTIFTASLGGGNQWQYDKTKQRIFRYFNPVATMPNTWLEYSEPSKELFVVAPGRVIWLKCSQGMQVQFGSGVTQTLKAPFTISLKPGSWTDFSLPFQFPVMLRDVLDATGVAVSKKLEVYQWILDESAKRYTAQKRYIGMLDTDLEKIKDTIVYEQPNNAYIVYNHDTATINLTIPPICLPLSKYSGVPVAVCDGKDARWQIDFSWQEQADAAGISRIPLAHDPGLETPSFYGPLPPSFDEMTVGVRDEATGTLCGYGIQSGLVAGGLTYTIEFVNNTDNDRDIRYRLENTLSLPEGLQAKILNPQTMIYNENQPDQQARMVVSAHTCVTRVVVAGSERYLDEVLSLLAPWTLQFVKAYPNPFRGAIKLQYTLPEGIQEVAFSLYDVKGRCLWQSIERKNVLKGRHVFCYNGATGKNYAGILSSGMYIVRMSAKDKKGLLLYAGEKRITRIR